MVSTPAARSGTAILMRPMRDLLTGADDRTLDRLTQGAARHAVVVIEGERSLERQRRAERADRRAQVWVPPALDGRDRTDARDEARHGDLDAGDRLQPHGHSKRQAVAVGGLGPAELGDEDAVDRSRRGACQPEQDALAVWAVEGGDGEV